ncbi:MAG TPA: sulfurtransferase [Polyangiales bacterium]|nr:sulfurtransferase [Polyangiales bacterium]
MALDPIITPHELGAAKHVALFDCRPETAAYLAGHLEGARHASLDRDLASHTEDASSGGRHPLPSVADFAALLGQWGVHPSTHVVAYDAQNGAHAAARFWWLLKAFGHEQVQVVDGGLQALETAGFALTKDIPSVEPAPPYPAHRFAAPLAEIDEVELARHDDARRVVDVRAAFRYRGESEPIDPIAGHIPGASNIPLSENLQPDGRFKTAGELRALYTEALGVPSSQAIIHCGSGVTACHTLLALERAGLPGAKLYVGSWSEWCRTDRPRA